ncbi:Ribosome biogenesis protein NOC1 [Fulvia fulva]|uniref:Ribosome biogenesis protein NOC1 n=1 Tax=Passalora fulva TaxID=5499 RepID=A0A9Q8P2A8_PASFU|nr:Ribosome biogenesis protein NOC1 [Fulvia fulva]KAK4635692.1 Ribosome biogenesis protein NOC1 [Fulvia fulva]KAK4637935.1 Ribosome biogenesis protein NOC1 [Fulvia fulva]UJO10800.1 Ribosome biogenesis protein NOC1 [Fulvia fulva]WPV09802.1 Ribosome biogenesis protein NOC1 [Fulvia fulva]WPV25206.1 Ribosome biogenesis protein NOC1 [Fulvia fulva]
MNAERKSFDRDSRPQRKFKPDYGRQEDRASLTLPARSDWHAAELPALDTQDVTSLPPQRTIDELHEYATTLLEAENKVYNGAHLSGSASAKFLSTIMESGTLEDRISALTLRVQESPLHTMKALDSLLGLAKKKSRNQALQAVAALKDMLGQGDVLPSNRKLRAFGKQPALLGALQGKSARWTVREALPSRVQKAHLIFWAFEDWLKRKIFELLQILETWCNDEIEYSRRQAITFVWELLKEKPEQEENLLRLLVNKLGDTERKIASRASHLLLQLETSHPALKTIVTNSIEADCLFRPGQSDHAKYYAIITLNQTIIGQKDQELANRLLEIYFSLFVQLLKPVEKTNAPATGVNSAPLKSNGKVQGGGGKAGKMAAKKQKAQERTEEAAVQLHDKMISQVLAGVNRAFPYADTSDPTFEQQLNTIFRVAHSANFNTSIQALMLLQQISSRKHLGAERFYRTLYESLLDSRLFGSSKQVMYLNLLYKSLKVDLNAKRVHAFVKRMLQVITMHEPPFACGVLFLVSELSTTFPSIHSMLTEAEVNDEDGEEHFVDVPEDGGVPVDGAAASAPKVIYDPRKRDPEHAKAERTCLWDILPLLNHFHPSVALFAEAVCGTKEMPPKPDPTQHTLMHFLDRFVYRNPSTKQAKVHGSSIMQPLAGSSSADLLVRSGGSGVGNTPVNTEKFWAKKVEDVAADEVFFHSYFNAAGNAKKRKSAKKEKKARGDDEDSEDEGEEEIWQAIAASRPEVEGLDEDDDISMDDLDSAYDQSDDESEAGLDLGGGDDEGDADAFAKLDGFEDDEGDMDDLPELESDDDAMLGDEDDVPFGGEASDEEEEEEEEEDKTARNKKKRQEKKKLKSLPTFASADDYAKLIQDDPDDV